MKAVSKVTDVKNIVEKGVGDPQEAFRHIRKLRRVKTGKNGKSRRPL